MLAQGSPQGSEVDLHSDVAALLSEERPVGSPSWAIKATPLSRLTEDGEGSPGRAELA